MCIYTDTKCDGLQKGHYMDRTCMETGVKSLAFFSTGENVCFSADSDKNNAQNESSDCVGLF